MNTIKLNEVGALLPQIDLFISAISFEQRCFSLIKNVQYQNFGKIWFTYNDNEKEFYLDNYERAKDYFNAEFISFSTDDPIITGKALLSKFECLNRVRNVLVDVSTFTHEGLLILFKFIDMFSEKFENVWVTYVGAKAYSTTEENDEDKWLSKGTKSIRSVLGYPGIMNPSQKNHLVILFGFEIERTTKLIENFEFDKVSIGIGPERESVDLRHYIINRQRHLDLIKTFPLAETFEFSLINPFHTAEQIQSQVAKYKNHNTVITPLNNKLSTVGAAFVALQNPKIQLCYVRAHEYNYKAYSTPSEDCYLYNIPNFDFLSEILKFSQGALEAKLL